MGRQESQSSRRTRRVVRGGLLLLAAAGGAGGIYILATVPPTDFSFYPGCQFHTLTGLHCPGCGTTRALHALLNGRIAQAFAYNAVAFLVLPVLIWSFVHSLRDWQRVTPVKPPSRFRQSPSFLPLVTLALLLLYSILRNIPAYPFTLLAPHEL